jgi:simple sugar transport system permease protein
MNNIIKSIFSSGFFYALIRVTTPILFATIGGSISNMAGVNNIALEGMMLVAGFVGVVVSAFTQSLLLALVAGVAAAIVLGVILAFFSLKLKADIYIAAIALNMFASGATVFFLYLTAHDKGSSAASLKSLVMPDLVIPGLQKVPVIGWLLGHNIMSYVAILAVILYWLILYHTPLGLRIRAVGQNPDAAASVGVSVFKTQFTALMLSSVFAALGGIYLCMGYLSWFGRDITSGRGFIGVAAAALGRSTPTGSLLASLLFGLVMTISIYMGSLNMPTELIEALPYIATVLALVIYSARQTRAAHRKQEEPKS